MTFVFHGAVDLTPERQALEELAAISVDRLRTKLPDCRRCRDMLDQLTGCWEAWMANSVPALEQDVRDAAEMLGSEIDSHK